MSSGKEVPHGDLWSNPAPCAPSTSPTSPSQTVEWKTRPGAGERGQGRRRSRDTLRSAGAAPGASALALPTGSSARPGGVWASAPRLWSFCRVGIPLGWAGRTSARRERRLSQGQRRDGEDGCPGRSLSGFSRCPGRSSLVARPGTWKTGSAKPQIRRGFPSGQQRGPEAAGAPSPRSWHSAGSSGARRERRLGARGVEAARVPSPPEGCQLSPGDGACIRGGSTTRGPESAGVGPDEGRAGCGCRAPPPPQRRTRLNAGRSWVLRQSGVISSVGPRAGSTQRASAPAARGGRGRQRGPGRALREQGFGLRGAPPPPPPPLFRPVSTKHTHTHTASTQFLATDPAG